MDTAALARFNAKVSAPTAQSWCWLWTGCLNRGGYGYFRQPKGSTTAAHRISYELEHGPIPPGMTIDHICHNNSGCKGGPTCLHRRCVNPLHLKVVPTGVNTRRSPLTTASLNAAKTHCLRGHAFTPENTYTYTSKQGTPCRSCRTCTNARSLARYYANKMARV